MICKECAKFNSRQYYLKHFDVINKKRKNYNKEYRQRAKGNINTWYTKTYGRMKRDNKKKFNKELPFAKQEFIEWININYKNLFIKLFQDYIGSGFDKYKNPSIDRINDYVGYTFDNMQLLTWKENDIKGQKE